jgi:hypothetical protein
MSENNQFNEAPSPAKRYSAAMDSVNLINARILAPQENQTQEQRTYDIERNVEHLKIAVAWDIWTNEDLSPLNSAISAGEGWLTANP